MAFSPRWRRRETVVPAGDPPFFAGAIAVAGSARARGRPSRSASRLAVSLRGFMPPVLALLRALVPQWPLLFPAGESAQPLLRRALVRYADAVAVLIPAGEQEQPTLRPVVAPHAFAVAALVPFVDRVPPRLPHVPTSVPRLPLRAQARAPALQRSFVVPNAVASCAGPGWGPRAAPPTRYWHAGCAPHSCEARDGAPLDGSNHALARLQRCAESSYACGACASAGV